MTLLQMTIHRSKIDFERGPFFKSAAITIIYLIEVVLVRRTKFYLEEIKQRKT